jgi:hypothetical protein
MSKFGWTYGVYFVGLAIGATLALGHFMKISPWGTAVGFMLAGLAIFKIIEWKKRRRAARLPGQPS